MILAYINLDVGEIGIVAVQSFFQPIILHERAADGLSATMLRFRT